MAQGEEFTGRNPGQLAELLNSCGTLLQSRRSMKIIGEIQARQSGEREESERGRRRKAPSSVRYQGELRLRTSTA